MAPSMKVIKKAKVLAPRPPYPLSLLPLVFFLMLNAHLLSAAEHREKGKPTPPGERCHTAPLPQWTGQEQWVWEQLCEGKIANFHEGEKYGGTLDPKTADGWSENRVLRAAFLEAILLHEPYQSALSHRGIRIHGAWFTEPLDLSYLTLAHPVSLHQSRFEKDISLRHLRTAYLLSFRGSTVLGTLDMTSVQVGDQLVMDRGAEFRRVILTAAKIQGDVQMHGAKFSDTLDMGSVQVGGTLFMLGGAEFGEAEFGEVVLKDAKIQGTVQMRGAKFTDTLVMDSVRVGGHLFMGEAEFGEVVLTAAKIEGAVQITGATFTSTKVNPSVPLRLIFAEIGGHVWLRAEAAISSIDLTGARIRGEFHLDSSASPATWQKDATVILQNAEVGALRAIPEVCPPHLELSGFRYAQLRAETIPRYREWLAKQATYSPQPYEQFAGVLQRMGHKDTAEDILYAGKDRELRASSGFDRVGLFLQKIFIGYGYRLHYALWWVLGFIVLGVLVLRLSKEGPRKNMPYGFAYSFDMLLPLIKLREKHYSMELRGWPRYYFYVHKIMGYVLASFLIAGLSGLTK